MCDEAVDDCLAALKLVSNWFVTSKIYKNLQKKVYTALYADENILYFDEDSGNVAVFCNEMAILSPPPTPPPPILILNIDLNNINLENNFDEDDPDATILIRLLVWYIKFEKRKALKKKISEELMPIV